GSGGRTSAFAFSQHPSTPYFYSQSAAHKRFFPFPLDLQVIEALLLGLEKPHSSPLTRRTKHALNLVYLLQAVVPFSLQLWYQFSHPCKKEPCTFAERSNHQRQFYNGRKFPDLDSHLSRRNPGEMKQ